jgi:hypothetical protein
VPVGRHPAAANTPPLIGDPHGDRAAVGHDAIFARRQITRRGVCQPGSPVPRRSGPRWR